MLSCEVVAGVAGCVPSRGFSARLGPGTGLALKDLFGHQDHRILTRRVRWRRDDGVRPLIRYLGVKVQKASSSWKA